MLLQWQYAQGVSQMKDEKNYLLQRIAIKGRLLTSATSVRESLKAYPQTRQFDSGTAIRCVIGLEGSDKHCVLSIEKDSLVFDFYSKTSSAYFMPEALLRVASVAAALAGDYAFEINGLFPYLVEALSSQLPRPRTSIIRRDEREGGDLILAKRIISLKKQNMQLNKDLASMRSKLLRLAALFIISRFGPNANIEEAAKESGISKEDVDLALRLMPEIGYKALPAGNGRFNVIKI